MKNKPDIGSKYVMPIKKTGPAYFIGIGGIGMSALARWFHAYGFDVSGYDRNRTSLTEEMESAGIRIHYEENTGLIPENIQYVIYTPAIPAENIELRYCMDKGYALLKRSDVLQMITARSFNICIAGTHGKTTTATMVAHILRSSGLGCNAFLGGISANYHTNFWRDENNISVAEADEYDKSFLKLSPDIAVITAMDPDHLDIYGTQEKMEQSFIDFSACIRPGGTLYAKYGLKHQKDLQATHHYTYSLQNDNAHAYAANIRMENGGYQYDVVVHEDNIGGLQLQMGGMHNVENSVAAIAVARSLEIDEEKIRTAIESFKGVKRRFEYIIPPPSETTGRPGIIYIDDYAHHPEELKALISGVRSLFRQQKCTIIFQPHLYSRTKDLAEGFARALDLADEVILLPVYPAREMPVPGVSSQLILDKMNLADKKILSKEELLQWLAQDYLKNLNPEFGHVLVTAGAGDIDQLVEPVKNIIKERI